MRKALVFALLLASCAKSGRNQAIRVGSKNFTEQVVLGEIVAQHLEHKLHVPVERKLNLGGTLLAHEALLSRNIDVYPEYTGTALAAVLKAPPVADPAAAFAQVRAAYARNFQIDWLDPLGIDDSDGRFGTGSQSEKPVQSHGRSACRASLDAGCRV
jgi:osmoprotectant transport system substrate-binding protein